MWILRRDPDGGLPPAHDLFRRGKRHAGQLRALAAMALERRRTAGRGQERHRIESHAVHFGCAGCTSRKAASILDPIVNLDWPYADPRKPDRRRLRMRDLVASCAPLPMTDAALSLSPIVVLALALLAGAMMVRRARLWRIG